MRILHIALITALSGGVAIAQTQEPGASEPTEQQKKEELKKKEKKQQDTMPPEQGTTPTPAPAPSPSDPNQPQR
jgi:hypothetical protein